MREDFFKKIMLNLEPYNQTYKLNMNELQHLSILIQMIQLVQHGRQELERKEAVDQIDKVLDEILVEMSDIMEENKNIDSTFDLNFHRMGYVFQENIRVIDPKLLPPMIDFSRPSLYIVPLLQQSKKRINTKLLKAMTKGTKCEEEFDRFSRLRRRRKGHLYYVALAWLIALFGTFFALMYLTRDYITAQRNMAVKVVQLSSSPLKLPAITICPNFDSIPSFADFPTAEYPGLPLWAITLYKRENRGEGGSATNLSYPQTLPDALNSPVESVIVGNNISLCSLKGFDVKREQKAKFATGHTASLDAAMASGQTCSHCFRIGHKEPEILHPFDESLSSAFSPAVQIRVSKPKLYGICEAENFRSNPTLLNLLQEELIGHAGGLEKRGILNFNGSNYSVLSGARRFTTDGQRNMVEMYCNVYFFSGFFYPNLDGANISYSYTGVTPLHWQPVGTGPYFSPYTWPTGGGLISKPNRQVIETDSFVIGGLRLYVEDGYADNLSKLVPPQNNFAILDRFALSTVFEFQKRVINEQVRYQVKKSPLLSQTYRNKHYSDSFNLGFDYQLFEVERFFSAPTMSASEFVTDVFEYVGLFTGICIFTLVVAPANRKYKAVVSKTEEKKYQTLH